VDAVAVLIDQDLVERGLGLLLRDFIQRNEDALQDFLEMHFGQNARPVRNDQKVAAFEHGVLPFLLVDEFQNEANVQSLVKSHLVLSLHFADDADQI